MTIIIKNVCLLLEMLSITMCLHQLYGEKYRLDIATVSLLAIDMIMMQAISYLGLPYTVSVLIYPIIVVYCGVKFGFKIKPILVNVILCMVIIGGTEMMVTLLFYFFRGIQDFSGYELLLVNCMVFVIIFMILPNLKVNKISNFLWDKENVIAMTILTCLIVILYIIISYKRVELMDLYNTFVFFICILFILILSKKMIKYKVKATEIEIELKMDKLYSESFQGLIDNIRLRQHEFDNHINTIYSQHFSCRTYEELVEVQKSYCEHIIGENRFNKLLAKDNSVLRGFLYGKFIEFDKMGINISYHVVIKELKVGVPIYKIIEILSDLMNNAVEALSTYEKRNGLYVSIVESNLFYLEVMNESPYISYDAIGNFFDKNYSKKGEDRGLGLYNVRRICEEYGLDICCNNVEKNENNWLSFKVEKTNFKR